MPGEFFSFCFQKITNKQFFLLGGRHGDVGGGKSVRGRSRGGGSQRRVDFFHFVFKKILTNHFFCCI